LVKVYCDTIVLEVVSLAHTPKMLLVWVVTKDGHKPLNDFLIFFTLLFTTSSIAVLKAWIIIIEVKLKMSWLLILFSAK
jgi:hypothetical protein